jgi:hypothetical protein
MSAAGMPSPSDWKLMTPNHGISGWSRALASDTCSAGGAGPEEAGFRLRERSIQLLKALGVPTDPRGIVLACGFMAAALFGLFAILTPPGDPIGWAYVGLAVVGYLFVQARIVTTGLWLLVAAGGAAVAAAGNTSGWLEAVVGVALAGISLIPPPAEYRNPSSQSRDLSQNGHSSSPIEVSPIQSSTEVEVSPSADRANGTSGTAEAHVTVRCLGRLQIEAGGREVSRFQREPRLEFLVSYLILRQLAGGRGAGDRAAVADEIAPLITSSSQKERLRKQLHELIATDPVFRHLIHADRAQVWIDIDALDLDVTQLLKRAAALRARPGVIHSKEAEALQVLMGTSNGEFLAGFSELERMVTGARGTAGQLVDQVRSQVTGARADIALALADYYSALDQPARAIPFLLDARRGGSERQDITKALAIAYLRTGDTAAATQVRREAELKEI